MHDLMTRFRWPFLLVISTGMLALACGDGSDGNEAAEAPDVGRGSSAVEVTPNEGPTPEKVGEGAAVASSAGAEDEGPSLSDDVARSIEEAAAAREEPFREGLRLFLVRVDRALAFPGEGFASPLFTPRVDHFANRVFSVTSDCQWSPDGRRIALSDSLGVWTVGAEDFGIWRVLEVPASALAWVPDSERLAVSSVDGVLIVDRLGEVLAQVAQEPVEAMAFSPDGRSVAYVSDRRDLSPLWVWRDGHTWQSPEDVYQFEWLGDGSLGVVSDDDEPIRVLRFRTW